MKKLVNENLEKILKNAKRLEIDWGKQERDRKKREEEIRRRKEKQRKQEEIRIKNMECPVCKSKKKEHIVKNESNGIMGPGFHSWEIDNYYICLDCGVMYKDLKKNESTG